MSNPNIGWLFYKDYFKDIDYINLLNGENEENEVLINQKVKRIINAQAELTQDDPMGSTRFQATTAYPGLILGSGNTHELPDIKGQAILGFHFDYTSGLPTIQSSSIKGVLRSAFKHQDYIKELIKIENIDIATLEKEIFDNKDIFFDATIIQADSFGKVLGDDYLAPHGNNLLKNPIPLRFIKVVPNVTFRFDFKLSDGLISKDQKKKLFKIILEDLGLGAKTNVGYGKFENFNDYKTEVEKQQEAQELEKQKEAEKLQREKEQEDLKKQKEQKAQGINNLKTCKDIKIAMKIINDSLGKKAKPTPEQKAIIESFWNKYNKKASKSEVKFFKKFF